MGGKNKQKTGLLFSCWILLVLVLVILYFVNKEKIASNFNLLFGNKNKQSSVPEKVEQISKNEKPIETNGLLELEFMPSSEEVDSKTEVIEMNNGKSESSLHGIEVEKQKENQTETKQELKKIEDKDLPKTKVNLCFVYVDSDGKVIRKITSKQIAKTNAPLTNAINALLSGPDSLDKNCMSLIPAGTRLLGASVKNGIATLNFSDEFEFNGINADSYRAQLMQVVYTATEFPTVESVQFLIEGQRKDYMGNEEIQVWIGSPYSRANFQ